MVWRPQTDSEEPDDEALVSGTSGRGRSRGEPGLVLEGDDDMDGGGVAMTGDFADTEGMRGEHTTRGMSVATLPLIRNTAAIGTYFGAPAPEHPGRRWIGLFESLTKLLQGTTHTGGSSLAMSASKFLLPPPSLSDGTMLPMAMRSMTMTDGTWQAGGDTLEGGGSMRSNASAAWSDSAHHANASEDMPMLSGLDRYCWIQKLQPLDWHMDTGVEFGVFLVWYMQSLLSVMGRARRRLAVLRNRLRGRAFKSTLTKTKDGGVAQLRAFVLQSSLKELTTRSRAEFRRTIKAPKSKCLQCGRGFALARDKLRHLTSGLCLEKDYKLVLEPYLHTGDGGWVGRHRLHPDRPGRRKRLKPAMAATGGGGGASMLSELGGGTGSWMGSGGSVIEGFHNVVPYYGVRVPHIEEEWSSGESENSFLSARSEL